MSTTDVIADMLTRIRNANMVGGDHAMVPSSKVKIAIAKVLKDEGFIKDYEVLKGDTAVQRVIRIDLKYTEDREPILKGLKRVSKPGLRVYSGKGEIPRVYGSTRGLRNIPCRITPARLRAMPMARPRRTRGKRILKMMV